MDKDTKMNFNTSNHFQQIKCWKRHCFVKKSQWVPRVKKN